VYKFAAASENELIVFGSARPGYSNRQIREWIDFMQNQGIHRVCCLLSEAQLNRYSDLLNVYQQAFGFAQICWAPIEDFNFADTEILIHQILPFLAISNQRHEAVVVHCSGGVGRTGHILAAWLVAGRGYSRKSAIAAVRQTGRNPHEAVVAALFKGRNPWKVNAELNMLLDECNFFRHSTLK
jgi:protein-tyrosine phosphatase